MLEVHPSLLSWGRACRRHRKECCLGRVRLVLLLGTGFHVSSVSVRARTSTQQGKLVLAGWGLREGLCSFWVEFLGRRRGGY
jgi:hypothetical protein